METTTVDPATQQQIDTHRHHTERQLEAVLERSDRAWRDWKNQSFEDRAHRFASVAETLEAKSEQLAGLMTREMGKPIEQATGEIEKCAWVCSYYAERARQFLEPTPVQTDASESHVAHEPLGPVLAVMPWNFPFWQVFRFAAPNLMAGNTGILKHAPNVQGCARAIADLFEECGFPEGVFQNLLVSPDRLNPVIADSRVQGVTLTGSTRAGRAVAKQAGASLKPSVLELGGSDPFIVLADANVEAAAKTAARSRTLNSGQSCIAAKRLIVEEPVADEFIDCLAAELGQLSVGDPSKPETDVGPIARSDLRDELHRQVSETVEQGATCELGGQLPEGTGFFYPVTLLTGVTEGMTAFEEETFGPVACVTRAEDADRAIELANATEYGLGASIWTQRSRGAKLVHRVRAGHVAVNGMVKSDPRLPFGGVKKSGYGRELGKEGILEFVNRKTVWIGDA